MRPGPSKFTRPDCSKSPCPLGTNPGRTHRFYTGDAVLPFGFGLSYTTFQYKILEAPEMVSLEPLWPLIQGARHGFLATEELEAAGPAAKYVINVTNTGRVDADDVVLGFLTPPGAGENG